MALEVITAPAIEPVTVEQIKIDLRIDADLTEHDLLIDSLIKAARAWVERYARRALITQTLRLTLDDWPANDRIVLPRPKLQSVASVKYTDSEGNENTFSSSSYFVDIASEPGRVVLNSGESWPSAELRPAAAIAIEYDSGFGDREDQVPETWKNAIRLLVAGWYETPEAIATSGAVPQPVPFGVKAMIDRIVEFA